MREGWEIKKLGEAFQIKPPKSEARETLQPADPVSFVPMEDLGVLTKVINVVKARKLEDVAGSYTYFGENDVLLAKITPCFENGKLGIAKNLLNEVGFGSSEFIVFRSKNIVTSEYLFYFLSRDEFRQEGKKRMTGAVGHKRVSKDWIENYPLPFPRSKSEQQRIVSILDEAFAAIDKAKANVQKNLRNTKELLQSELNRIFWQKGEGWEETTLNHISQNLDSKRIPITKNQRTAGNFPYYGASGIVDYVNDYIFDDDLLLVSEDGANLLARTYPIAFSISGKSWVNNHAHVLKFDSMTTQSYVEFYLNSIKLNPFVSGMAQPKLNQTMLNKIPIPYPPFDQQQVIVTKLRTLIGQRDKLERLYNEKLTQLEALKKSILQQAFNGELTKPVMVDAA